MKFSLIEIGLIAAASQGLFLSIIIYFKSEHLYANRILSFVVFLFSFLLFDLFLNDIGFYILVPHLRVVTIGLVFLNAPLFFLYVHYLTHAKNGFSKIDFLHFLPFLLVTITYFYFFYTQFEDHQLLMQKMQRGDGILFLKIFQWLVAFQFIFYVTLAAIRLFRFEKEIKTVFSNIDRIHLHWLRNISLLLLTCGIVFLVESLIVQIKGIQSYEYLISSISTAASVYTMGYSALFRSTIFSKPILQMREMSDSSNNPNSNLVDAKKYLKSEISPDVANSQLKKLLDVMETEKPYLLCDLTLTQLAEIVGISSHNLSQILNTYLHKNFYEYINTYRINEVKNRLNDPSMNYLNILSIAFDCGFNSKSSFNTIFKNNVGQTPSQYRNRIKT